MKLDRIQIDNFLGAHHIDVKLNKPVTLFAGPNGAAKSSIGEAVRMAMTGETVRVKLKKEYPHLVTDGAKAGGALITLADERTYAFNVPTGDIKSDDGLPTGDAVEVSLNGQRFTSMDDQERRTFLFKVTGIRIKPDDIRERMVARSCDAAKIEAALPMLRTGFPAACDLAKKKATEAKGAWRQVTNATYGSKVAEAWKATPPEPLQAAAPTPEIIAAFDSDIADLNTKIGGIAAQARARADAETKRTALESLAGSVARVVANLSKAKTDLAEFEPKVTEMRQRASGTKRIGLVHDMALFIGTMTYTVGSPEEIECTALLDKYEDEHGELCEVGTIDLDAQSSLPEYERGFEVMKNAVTNLTRDLQTAETAKAQFDLLAQPIDAAPLEDVTALQTELASLKADRTKAQELMTVAQQHAAKVAAATKTTADAAAHHKDVLAWTVVADALAPDGIPGDLLKEALAPVNEALSSAADQTGWKKICISQEMDITADGRPYALLSESEKWRTDAMIAATVANLSGIKILMLDRVDVLDLPGRAALLAWVHTLVNDGEIDTALLFATLKTLPAKLYDTMAAHWVEAGSIAEFKVAA